MSTIRVSLSLKKETVEKIDHIQHHDKFPSRSRTVEALINSNPRICEMFSEDDVLIWKHIADWFRGK